MKNDAGLPFLETLSFTSHVDTQTFWTENLENAEHIDNEVDIDVEDVEEEGDDFDLTCEEVDDRSVPWKIDVCRSSKCGGECASLQSFVMDEAERRHDEMDLDQIKQIESGKREKILLKRKLKREKKIPKLLAHYRNGSFHNVSVPYV